MAKVTGPLLSLDARGQIGKALVFSNWKGIQDVRQFVVPSNPNTAAQQTQRGKITSMNALWHSTPWTADDLTAWNVFAAEMSSVMSGFNAFTRQYCADIKAGLTVVQMSNIVVSAEDDDGFTVVADVASDETCSLYLGAKKTQMTIPFLGVFSVDHLTFTVTGLDPSTTYYFYLLNEAANKAGRTGIYTADTTATP